MRRRKKSELVDPSAPPAHEKIRYAKRVREAESEPEPPRNSSAAMRVRVRADIDHSCQVQFEPYGAVFELADGQKLFADTHVGAAVPSEIYIDVWDGGISIELLGTRMTVLGMNGQVLDPEV